MAIKFERWQALAPSGYPWEKHGLDYIRQGLPDVEPWRVWSNFEFQAFNGALYEVDLLVLSKTGFYLVELKHRTGRLRGDTGTWTWTRADGSVWSEDNPYQLANRKARALASLLGAQPAFKGGRPPFLAALVFVYHTGADFSCELYGQARSHICLKDELEPNKAGILAALKGAVYQGAPTHVAHIDTRMAKTVGHALEEAGIRRSQKYRRVGDYELTDLLFEGPDFQDRLARHTSMKGLLRRIRIYPLEQAATDVASQRLKRAAQREFQILQGTTHAGIVAVHDYKEHELGPALIFDYDADAIRLDHFLLQRGERLKVGVRLHLVRQLAEVVQYMHQRRIVHRGLSPESILVTRADTDSPHLKIYNWQTGQREGGTSGTSHVQDLVERQSLVYLAPEAVNTPGEVGEYCDVFSLGAVAYHIFAGVAPANHQLELYEKLAAGRGLKLSTVVDGASTTLEALIQRSTHPDVLSRIDSATDFLELLGEVEKEIAGSDGRNRVDPLDPLARTGDDLGQGYTFLKRLGQGSTAVALLAEDESGREVVLKVAQTAEDNSRLEIEAEALSKVRHPYVVELLKVISLGTHTTLVLSRAGDKTLATRLREDGPLGVDLLQRFGEDLLSALQTLEEQGINHRDIKPENLGVAAVGRSDALHLVLFDFSLTRAPLEQIYVGTTSYRDPFLRVRQPPRWDLNAERYSAAVTLFEMATGVLPVWGDGKSDPSLVECEPRLGPGTFDPPELQPHLAHFFTRALNRDPRQRFDNAEEMRRAWSRLFEGLDMVRRDGVGDEQAHLKAREEAIHMATLDTPLTELNLSTRARGALQRSQIHHVRALLGTPSRTLQFMRGVGKKTRDEILLLSQHLRQRFPVFEPTVEVSPPSREGDALLSVDQLLEQVMGPRPRSTGLKRWQTRALYLGSQGEGLSWPTQVELSRQLEVTRALISAQVVKDREEWRQLPALQGLVEELVEWVSGVGGLMEAEELCQGVLATRGCVHEDIPRRLAQAAAVVRAALEVESLSAEPRLHLCRTRDCLLIVTDLSLEGYARMLGEVADKLAQEEVLPPPSRVKEALMAVEPAPRLRLRPDRLIKVAAMMARVAAVSGRQEFYPRDMAVAKALKLAAGSLVGADSLTLDELKERLYGRFPLVSPLPARPELDALLQEADLNMTWDPTAQGGQGAFRRATRPALTLSTRLDRPSTTLSEGSGPHHHTVDPTWYENRSLDDILARSQRDGGFLVLTVRPQHLYRAEAQLLARYGVRRYSLDEGLIEALHEQSRLHEVEWGVVLEADREPGTYDWNQLQELVTQAVGSVQTHLHTRREPLLLVDAGLLVRYDRLEVLEHLRDQVGRPDQPPFCWLLLPNDEQQGQPTLDRKVIPLINAAQRARIPSSWLS